MMASLAGWLLYPVTALLRLFAFLNPRWLTATVIGLVVFVGLMALLPDDFDSVVMGSRAARPLCAYLGGLLITGAVLLVVKLGRA